MNPEPFGKNRSRRPPPWPHPRPFPPGLRPGFPPRIPPGFPPGHFYWHRRPRFLFARLALLFGVIALLVVGSMAVLAFLLTQLLGSGETTALVVWLGGCGLGLVLPLLAYGLARQAFQGIATPLAHLMAAAEAVAAGDLGVRVREGPGEFGRLARSFNHMVQELERAEQQRRNLTADVAHELRTPLHLIQGNLEGILDGVYAPTPEHINATLEETRLLARLVDDLRTLSLAEAGQLPLVRETVDVAELLADIQTSFSGQAEAAGLELRLETAESLSLKADIDRLTQVISNLVVNALRHTPPGGAVTLRAEPISTGVRITVRDTGEGIPPEELPYIFDRFWRGDRARSHTGGSGGGLGLAIARQLVQAHGGTIEVESQVGRGSTFTVELPVG